MSHENNQNEELLSRPEHLVDNYGLCLMHNTWIGYCAEGELEEAS